MNKSTYRFLVVALLAVLVLFIVSGQFKIILQSGNEEGQRTVDTDVDELGSNPATSALNSSPIGFEYNSKG
jgi:hypothetical protein